MSTNPTPSPTDVLSVRSRVSWGALIAGAMVALTIYCILNVLGLALGLELAVREPHRDVGAAAAIYSILVILLAMFFGGWATSRLAVGESKLEAVLYGLILWGLLFAGMIWLVSAGLRTGFGAMVGLTSGAYTVARDAEATRPASEPGAIEALRRRYDTELGGERFVEDLQKAGFTEEQARKAQQETRSAIERLRKDPGSAPEVARDLADNPEVRQAAARAVEGARMATWWTLLGMIVSLAAVVVGSLVGAGELLQPVPILGVRRDVHVTRRPA